MEIRKGSPQDEFDLRKAFLAHTPDAIITALSSKKVGFMAGVHRNIVNIIKSQGQEKFTKVLTMQAFGVGSSNKNMWWPFRVVFSYTPLSKGHKDHDMVDEVMRQSGLRWTLVRPVMLTDGEKNYAKDCGDSGDAEGMGNMPSISRRSVAGFLIDIAENRTATWAGRTPVLMD